MNKVQKICYMLNMLFFLAIAIFTASMALARDDSEVGCVTTEWRLFGANNKVCVYAFDDPDVRGVTCYISQAKTGGMKGTFGLAEDPSNFSISCCKTGKITIPANLPKEANVYKESTSLFFKATRVIRMWDKKRNSLVYLAISKRVIAGSPYNSISTIQLED